MGDIKWLDRRDKNKGGTLRQTFSNPQIGMLLSLLQRMGHPLTLKSRGTHLIVDFTQRIHILSRQACRIPVHVSRRKISKIPENPTKHTEPYSGVKFDNMV